MRTAQPRTGRQATARRGRSARGFSLMEVLVAVALLSIALVGLTRGLVMALASSRDSALLSQAVWVAAARVEFLRADYLPSEGESEGTTGEFNWRQRITRTATDGLFEVHVEVSRGEDRVPLYALDTLVFDPPPASGETDRERERGRRRERRQRGGTQ